MNDYPVKEEQKEEFYDQILQVFFEALNRMGIFCNIDDERDQILEQLENIFRKWGVTAPKKPMIDYRFHVSMNEKLCPGTISVKAESLELAMLKANEQVKQRLMTAFPDLDIPYQIMSFEEPKYPKYRVLSKADLLMPDTLNDDIYETLDHDAAVKYYEEKCKEYSFVVLKIRTCSEADWSLLDLNVSKNCKGEK